MMQNAAILWHVALLTPDDRDGLALGLVGLVRVAPIVVFSLASGVAADAFDRRKLMTWALVGGTLTAATLAFITFAGLESVWPLYLLTALTATASAAEAPARQALVPSLVPVEHLANALSLNTIMFHAAAVIGPTCAGLVIATFGIGWVYLSNSISFVAVIAALACMRDVREERGGARAQVGLQSLMEGLRFVFGTPMIRSTMLLDFFATFFSSATALLPIFAQSVLHVGAAGYGWLYAATSIGSLAASVVMVRRAATIERRGRVLVWAIVGYGLATIVFGLSQSFLLTFACLALVGAADTVSTVVRNIIRQLSTPDHLRGRMTSVNMIFFMGGPQLGELEAGIVAQFFGAPLAVVSGGAACLAATAIIVQRTPEVWRHDTRETALEAS
jgi:MFS family permease